MAIELETLKQAAQARPALPAPLSLRITSEDLFKVPHHGARKGRQAGDISIEWRKVLHRLVANANRKASYSDVLRIAEICGIKTKMPNVRERVRSMVENKLMTGNAEDGFKVSEHAIQRFKLAQTT
jgi:hypothetical protein